MQAQGEYAIVRTGGKQYRVSPGQKLTLELCITDKAVGDELTFSEVLMVSNAEGSDVKVGSPTVEGRSVTAKITAFRKGPKLVVFKKRRRQRYVKKNGHRSTLTDLLIQNIN